jgi:hypothetical protein
LAFLTQIIAIVADKNHNDIGFLRKMPIFLSKIGKNSITLTPQSKLSNDVALRKSVG